MCDVLIVLNKQKSMVTNKMYVFETEFNETIFTVLSRDNSRNALN